MGGGAQLWNPTPPPLPPSPQLNASDDRGIDIVRGPILSFASTRTIFKWVGGTEVGGEEQDAGGRDKDKQMRTAVWGHSGAAQMLAQRGKVCTEYFHTGKKHLRVPLTPSPAASERQLAAKPPRLALSQERLQARHPG